MIQHPIFRSGACWRFQCLHLAQGMLTSAEAYAKDNYGVVLADFNVVFTSDVDVDPTRQ